MNTRPEAQEAGTPARVISDAVVERGCIAAVEATGLYVADWPDKYPDANQLRKVIRAALQAAISLPTGDAAELPEAAIMTHLGNEGFTADQMHAFRQAGEAYYREMHRAANKRAEGLAEDAAMFKWLSIYPNLYTVTDLLRADQYVTLRRACESLMPFDTALQPGQEKES